MKRIDHGVAGKESSTGGCWSLLAVPTPDAPRLTITFMSTNTAIISWPFLSTGFALQQNADLSTANWTTLSEIVTDNGTTKSIGVSPAPGNRFFRLFKP